MTPEMAAVTRGPSRREFLGTVGALVVSVALGRELAGAEGVAGPGAWPAQVPPDRLDSWLAVRPDGTVVAAVGKIEAGMGVSTAFAQFVAEELDVPIERVSIRMGDTATTVDQRGTGSSNGIVQGGAALRRAGAQARHALLGLAAEALGVPAAELTVTDGMVFVRGEPERRISYGELVDGREFDLALSDQAQPKPASEYRVVGQSVPRGDIPPKVTAAYEYLVDLKVPGMVHARVVRPPGSGARCLAIEPGQRWPGLVRIVQRGEFVAVVCEREEQAIQAARELRVRWSEPKAVFSASYDALYDTLRTTGPKATETPQEVGDVEAALAGAARVIEADYEYPFQSHASMGPACGVADVGGGRATVWMGGQKPYPLRQAVAALLGFPIEQVRVVWLPGPGSYGMNDADDAAIDAVLLSREIGRPVRVQYMRHDGTAWDPKGPPAFVHVRGGLDAVGQVAAVDFVARGYSARVRAPATQNPGDALSVQLIGGAKGAGNDRFPVSAESYAFPAKRRVAHVIPWAHALPTGLRTSHLRDPDGPAMCFASECFIDELAAAAGVDPVVLRLRYLGDARDRAVVEAAAARAGWEPRPSPRTGQSGPWRSGRGLAYAPRNQATVALVAEVDVNIETGALRVRRFVVAHDCGFVVNPGALIGTIEANVIQAMSRALHEAVQFTATAVTSVDWSSYPILDITEVPEAIDIVLLNNRPDAVSRGAGEPATRPVAAALGNAIFDATGVRIRRVPFTAKALREAFARATAGVG